MATNATKKVKIASMGNINENWVNFKGEDGLEYGIGKEKSPTLYAKAKELKAGDEIEGQYWEKNGKHYLFEVKENKGGGKGNPNAYDARSAAEATSTLLALAKESVSKERYDEWFEHIYQKIQSKSKTT